MSVATRTAKAEFPGFNQRSSSATERIENQIISSNTECREILPHQMRWIGKDESIPVVDWQIFLLNCVDGAIAQPARAGGRCFQCLACSVVHTLRANARWFLEAKSVSSGFTR